MPTSYLDLTNRLLRRLNEATIDQADFASVRGVQAMAKDVINSAIEQINLEEFEWPFNAASTSQVLTVGQEEYDFPAALKIPKWDSFHLTESDALGVGGKPLAFISRDQYYRYLKNADDVSASDGLGPPKYVFEKQGFGFGVAPSPDKAYTVTYEYFSLPTRLVDYDDEPTIYPVYDEAIIQGALYHYYMFRDNTEQALVAEKAYMKWLGIMRKILINKYDRMVGTYIPRRNSGDGQYVSDYFR